MNLYSRQFTTPYGEMIVAVNENDALVQVILPNEQAYWGMEIVRKHYVVVEDRGQCDRVVQQLDEYFQKKRRAFDLPLAPQGTPFQQTVWAALQTIPYGTTISYRQLAEQIGNLAAIRAVGRANGSNPIPIVIPCHRVIGTDGLLTGFGGGLPLKAKLLKLEGVRVREPAEMVQARLAI
ncbi:MAG: methylated-DNA--[protein]-cysteine S-methyltransferase [Aggregatilineales bacterium]